LLGSFIAANHFSEFQQFT